MPEISRRTAVSGHVFDARRMLGPFNNPNVDDSGFYVPFYSNALGPATPGPFISQFATVVVKPRAGQRPDTLAGVLRREVQKADPNLPLYFLGTPSSQLDVFVAQNRIVATMFSIFGAVAVILASVGIYGVMIANLEPSTECKGHAIDVEAHGDGSFVVTNSRNNVSRTYGAR